MFDRYTPRVFSIAEAVKILFILFPGFLFFKYAPLPEAIIMFGFLITTITFAVILFRKFSLKSVVIGFYFVEIGFFSYSYQFPYGNFLMLPILINVVLLLDATTSAIGPKIFRFMKQH